MANAEVQELIRDIRKFGFQVEINGKGAKVFKDGKPVLLQSGTPATIHLTPSDSRWKANLVSEFRKARILPEDYGREGQLANPREISVRRVAEAGRAAQMAAAKLRLEERVKPLTLRLAKILETLEIPAAELARLAIEWGEAKGKRVPKNANSSAVSLARILRGEGSSEWILDLFEGLADDLEGKTREQFTEEQQAATTAAVARHEAAQKPLQLVKTNPLACEYPGCNYVATAVQGKKVHEMSHREAVCPECLAAGAEKTTYKANAIGRHRYYAHGVTGKSHTARGRAALRAERNAMTTGVEAFAEPPTAVAELVAEGRELPPAAPVSTPDVLPIMWQAVGALRAQSLGALAHELQQAAAALAAVSH